MDWRPQTAITKGALGRRSRAAVSARRAMRAAFDRCGAVILVLPPFVMAHVPYGRFDREAMAAFCLRPAHNEDTPRPKT